MTWVLLDVAVGLAAVLLLGVTVLRLWRRVRGLGSALAAASATVGDATLALERAQARPAAVPARTLGPSVTRSTT